MRLISFAEELRNSCIGKYNFQLNSYLKEKIFCMAFASLSLAYLTICLGIYKTVFRGAGRGSQSKPTLHGELTHNSPSHFPAFLGKVIIPPICCMLSNSFHLFSTKEPRKTSFDRGESHLQKLNRPKNSDAADPRERFVWIGHFPPPCCPHTIRTTGAAAPAAPVPPAPLTVF